MSGQEQGRELVLSVTLKDCEVQHFRAGGPGGQHQNKTSSASRVIHEPSGARGESREHREQRRNTRAAFIRMTETKEFKLWLELQLGRMDAAAAEADRAARNRVERDMKPENLLVEYFDPEEGQ